MSIAPSTKIQDFYPAGSSLPPPPKQNARFSLQLNWNIRRVSDTKASTTSRKAPVGFGKC